MKPGCLQPGLTCCATLLLGQVVKIRTRFNQLCHLCPLVIDKVFCSRGIQIRAPVIQLGHIRLEAFILTYFGCRRIHCLCKISVNILWVIYKEILGQCKWLTVKCNSLLRIGRGIYSALNLIQKAHALHGQLLVIHTHILLDAIVIIKDDIHIAVP